MFDDYLEGFVNRFQRGIQIASQLYVLRNVLDLHQEMLLKTTQATEFAYRLFAHPRTNADVQ